MSDNNAPMTANAATVVSGGEVWTREQIDLIKRMAAPGATDDELRLFLYQCRRLDLDPLLHHVYFIRRPTEIDGQWQMVGTIQVGIDGLRLAAFRTGQYAGQVGPEWCGPDGEWHDVWLSPDPPAAARVGVYRQGWTQPVWGVARWTSYVQRRRDGKPTRAWAQMPDLMIAKCFSRDTEVLTDQGFRPFPEVGDARILQVTPNGLEAVNARPFVQPYDGPMLVASGDMLNFAVTPNHDMVTTAGIVSADVLYATARVRPKWWIPLCAPGRTVEADISDADLQLAGYIAADGTHNGYRRFLVAVSRSDKRRILERLAPLSVRERHDGGTVAVTAKRAVYTRRNKVTYAFPVERVGRLLDPSKRFRIDTLLTLSQRQARLLFDAWQAFDGSTNAQTGVRRLYTSRLDHLQAMEVLAVLAGYTVSRRRSRVSDIGSRPNWSLTISEAPPQPVVRPTGHQPGVTWQRNDSPEVWCVTVPSGQIVVRRQGFSMVCGNCAEALALRRAFPDALSGVYIPEESAEWTPPEPTGVAPASLADHVNQLANRLTPAAPPSAADTAPSQPVDEPPAPAPDESPPPPADAPAPAPSRPRHHWTLTELKHALINLGVAEGEIAEWIAAEVGDTPPSRWTDQQKRAVFTRLGRAWEALQPPDGEGF